MPTTQSTTSSSRKTAAKKAAATRAKDAINLLKADHRKVEGLFSDFEKARAETRKTQLAKKICMELKVHTRIEEEIFYPSCREFLDDGDLVDEALVEHQAAKELIAKIEAMDVSDEMFDPSVKVLQEQIEHHVEEEETELFPKVKKTDMDTKAVGERLMMRKKELMAQMKGDGMEMH
ncbi:MAG TPA: hemerythrin domain-containing protein [Phenylobacterium sp.]|jgi:hemerythrin superfamily protein|nr:hemerythrin domain-containing protein [Phenylobacterium sp.]